MTFNPLCWIFGHKQFGCTCDGGTCEDYGVWCPADHCRRIGCEAPLVELPTATATARKRDSTTKR